MWAFFTLCGLVKLGRLLDFQFLRSDHRRLFNFLFINGLKNESVWIAKKLSAFIRPWADINTIYSHLVRLLKPYYSSTLCAYWALCLLLRLTIFKSADHFVFIWSIFISKGLSVSHFFRPFLTFSQFSHNF